MVKMKKLITGACAIAMLAGMAGCGTSNADSGKTTLDFMPGLGEGPLLDTVSDITQSFEKANPTIKINLIPASDNLEQDIKVRLASKNAPDLWNTHGWSRDRYSDFLEPLQNRSWASRLAPEISSSIKKDDNSFYALPMDVTVTGIIYNKKVLKDAGIEPTKISTWDDFDKACEAVISTGADCIGGSSKDNLTVGHIADYVASGTYTESQEKELLNGTFDSSIWQKITNRFAEWKSKGYFNKDFTAASNVDLQKYMASNKLAFTMQMNGFAASVISYDDDAQLGFMPLPASNGESPYLVSGEDFAVGVSNTSKHKDQAFKYLDYLAKDENIEKMSKVLSAAPGLTGVKADLGDLSDSYEYWVTKKATRTVPFFDRVYLPNGMWDTLCTSSESVVSEQGSAEEAADQVKTQFQSLYKKA